MKSVKDFRTANDFDSSDAKRSKKLAPSKKSGKERHNLYGKIANDDDDIELDYKGKRESAFDYFDDGDQEN